MPGSKLGALVRKLYLRTTGGKVVRESTTEEDEFQTDFPRYSVVVFRRRLYGAVGERVFVRLVDSKGQIVEEIIRDLNLAESEHDGSIITIMADLFAKARRSALGSDKAVDEILSYLDAAT